MLAYVISVTSLFVSLIHPRAFVWLFPILALFTPKALTLVDVIGVPVLSVNRFLVFCLVISVSVRIFISQKIIISKLGSPIKLPLLVLIISIVASMVVNPGSIISGGHSAFISILEVFLPVFVYVYMFRSSEKYDIRLHLKSIYLIIVSIGIYGSVAYLLDWNPYIDLIEETINTNRVNVTTYEDTLRGERALGTISHPITYGAFLVIGVYIGVFLLFSIPKASLLSIIYYSVGVLILFSSILLTNSRSPLLFLLIPAFFVFIQFRLKAQIGILAAFLVLGFSAFISVDIFRERILSILNIFIPSIGNDMYGSTIDMRLDQMSVAYRYFISNPLFGNGPNTARGLVESGAEPLLFNTESLLFVLMIDYGLLGLIAYMVLFWSLWRSIFRCKVKPKYLKWIPLGMLAGYIVFVFITGVMGTLQLFLLVYVIMYYSLKKISSANQVVSSSGSVNRPRVVVEANP